MPRGSTNWSVISLENSYFPQRVHGIFSARSTGSNIATPHHMRDQHLTALNAETRYVRVTGEARGGFVEFQFAIGDPTLYLDMILPPAAFAEFCATNKVVRLSAEQGSMVDRDRRKWRGGDAAQ